MVSKKKSQTIMMPHSKAKVEFYEKYLERYLPIMSNTKYVSAIHIYDFFCGRGIYENGGEGSPVRAVKAIVNAKKNNPSNTRFTLDLNDLSTDYIEMVKSYIAKTIPDYRRYCEVNFSTGDAVQLLEGLGDILAMTKNDERNLLFIDPYGYSLIHKETIERILNNRRTEIILFLPVSFMYRFNGYAFDSEASKGVAPLREFIESYFPVDHPMRRNDGDINVHKYIDYLKEAFSYNGRFYTASYQIERNSNSFFSLFFITSNLRGFEKIVEVKWYLDEDNGNSFRLASLSPQETLFNDFFASQNKIEHGRRLAEYLLDYLKECRDNGELFVFVLKKGYLPKHATGVLKQLQDEGKLDVINIETGVAARRGSFYLNYEGVSKPKVRFILK